MIALLCSAIVFGVLLLPPDGVDTALSTFKHATASTKPLKARLDAIESISRNGDPRVATALVDLLDAEERRQAEIRKELDDLTEKLRPYQKGRLLAGEWNTHDKLVADRKAVSVTLAAEEEVTRMVIAGLSGMPEGKALEPVLDACRRHSSVAVRARAAEALGRATADGATPALIQALSDKDARVRIAALDALGVRHDTAAVDKILTCLKDASWSVRSSAIAALASIGEVRAAGAMIPLFDTEEGRLRDDLVRGLEKLTGQKLGLNPTAWQGWWRDHDSGAPAPAPSGGPKPATAPSGDSRYYTYHGIPTSSHSIIFIWDISDSMREDAADTVIGPDGIAKRDGAKRSKFEVASQELIRAINALDEKGSFNVVAFNQAVIPWQKKLVPATKQNKADAIAVVKATQPSGATNIFDALEMAFGMAGIGLTDKAYVSAFDTIFLLSDGAPSEGRITDTKEILKAVVEMNKLKKVVLHTIGMGKLHDRPFMSSLAQENGGKYVALE